MTTRIYRLDDGGAIFHITANDRNEAREQWVSYMSDNMETDYEDPEITLVQLAEATKIMVTDDEHRASCPTCGTPDAVPKERSLLEVWQENNGLPAEKRARYGILCCSEWP